MYQAHHKIAGKTIGNFRYGKTDLITYHNNLKRKIRKWGVNKIFIPHCDLGTQVARLGDGNEKIIAPWFIRTNPGFDGAMLFEPNVAIGILNADCPIITLFDQRKSQLVLLHGGLKCLMPERISEPDIAESAFRNFKLNPDTLEVFIGFGAGPCCYGIDHITNRRAKFNGYLQKATRGPRTGQDSLNLFELAKDKLLKCGVRPKAITINNECTACNGRDDNPLFHSNIYDGETGGRNLSFAWFNEI